MLEIDHIYDRLASGLESRGVRAVRHFSIPGSDEQLPLYLPDWPRVSVVLVLESSSPSPPEKTLSNSAKAAVLAAALLAGPAGTLAMALAKHMSVRNLLGPRARTIVVHFDGTNTKSAPPSEDNYLVHLNIGGIPTADDTIARVVTAIEHRLADWKQSRTIVRSPPNSAALAAAVVPAETRAFPILGIFGAIGAICAPLSGSMLLNRVPPQTARWLKDAPADEQDVQARNDRSVPSPEQVMRVRTQTEAILAVFQTLSPDTFERLAHEMDNLMQEFALGHYTACAMRGGRSLETIIYELSRKWGIAIQDSDYEQLARLRQHIDYIGDLVSELRLESRSGTQIEERIDNALRDLNAKTMDLALSLRRAPSQGVSELVPNGPRPLIALLKKIMKQYGHLDGMGAKINALIRPRPEDQRISVMERILRIRNRAAHADVHGQPQEIDNATVSGMLDDINLVLITLSTLDCAIAESV